MLVTRRTVGTHKSTGAEPSDSNGDGNVITANPEYAANPEEGFTMSYVLASERSVALSARRKQKPSHIIPNTEFLDLSYDKRRRALWIYLTKRAPAYVSLDLIHDLLGVDNLFATSLAAKPGSDPDIRFKVIASKREGVFSLGGDLASFRYCIDQQNRNALTQYANAALDAIWTNVNAAGIEDMTTVALVQGEAQGGGFEAALSAQVLVAEKGSMFGFPEALFGMFPGMGAFSLLSARTSPETARRLIGSTSRYPAELLHEMGVVDLLAEPGQGQETVEQWMLECTPEDTARYRERFSNLDHAQLVDSIEEWVDQAMCLNQRQLRTMGYILEAQKRASAKPADPKITPLRRKVEFADLDLGPVCEQSHAHASPLLISPHESKRYDDRELVAFIKGARPWLYENLLQHGAVVLRGFVHDGVPGLNRLVSAIRTERTFRASRAVPSLDSVHDNLSEVTGWERQNPQALHSAYADCTVFPSYKAVAFMGGAGRVALASTRAIYTGLDQEVATEFEQRGITYRRRFPAANSISGHGGSPRERACSWENVFQCTSREQVEHVCRANGLSYRWLTDGAIEVWNCAPAALSHRETGERLWFNLVYQHNASGFGFAEKKRLFTKLLSIVRPPFSAVTTFGDGSTIPKSHLDEIARAHVAETIRFELADGDVLVMDNTLCAQGRDAIGMEQRYLVGLY